jgi:hypothetical protein
MASCFRVRGTEARLAKNRFWSGSILGCFSRLMTKKVLEPEHPFPEWEELSEWRFMLLIQNSPREGIRNFFDCENRASSFWFEMSELRANRC